MLHVSPPLPLLVLNAEDAQRERLRIQSERMELRAQTDELLARSRELLKEIEVVLAKR